MATRTQVIDKEQFDALNEATGDMVKLPENKLAELRRSLLTHLIEAECPVSTATNVAENVKISIMVTPAAAEKWEAKESMELSESFAESLIKISNVLSERGCPEDQLEDAIIRAVNITVVQGEKGDAVARHIEDMMEIPANRTIN